MNAEAPTLSPGRPDCPDHLDEVAGAEWVRITEILEKIGVLTEADGPALEIYCEAYARKRQAQEELKAGIVFSTDNGGCKTNPAAAVVKSCEGTMLRVLSSFGLTAVDRPRVRSSSAKKVNRLGAFLSKKSRNS